MADRAAKGDPSSLRAFDPGAGEVTAVIETPKGSRNTYTYDEEHPPGLHHPGL